MQLLEPTRPIDDVLEPYRAADRPVRGDRPWVLANMVAALDGSASVGGRVGELSGATDRALFRLLRSLADVVLVGAETVRAEDYGPAQLPEDLRERRVADGRSPVPRIAVVTRSLRLDPGARLFGGDPGTRPMVITCDAADRERREALADVADVLVTGEAEVDLAAALVELRHRGAGAVLCEGGPALLGQLVEHGQLDELCLTLTPVMGGDSLPVSVSPVSTALTRFHLAHVLTDADSLFLRYEREGRR